MKAPVGPRSIVLRDEPDPVPRDGEARRRGRREDRAAALTGCRKARLPMFR